MQWLWHRNLENKYSDPAERYVFPVSAAAFRMTRMTPLALQGNRSNICTCKSASYVILHFKSCPRLFNDGSCPDPTANSTDVMNPVNFPRLAFKYRRAVDSTRYPPFHNTKRDFSLLRVFFMQTYRKSAVAITIASINNHHSPRWLLAAYDDKVDFIFIAMYDFRRGIFN